MDITWEYETAAAERRGEYNAQMREDTVAAEDTWLDLVRLFSRERAQATTEVAVRETRVIMSSGQSIAVPYVVVSSVITPRPSFFRRLFTLGA